MSAIKLGPFRVLIDDDGKPFPGSQTISDDRSNDVADVYSRDDTTNDVPQEVAVATARLFAAAPDLLAALQEMVATFKPFTFKPVGAPNSAARADQDNQKAVHAQALAAIAKAKAVQQ